MTQPFYWVEVWVQTWPIQSIFFLFNVVDLLVCFWIRVLLRHPTSMNLHMTATVSSSSFPHKVSPPQLAVCICSFARETLQMHNWEVQCCKSHRHQFTEILRKVHFLQFSTSECTCGVREWSEVDVSTANQYGMCTRQTLSLQHGKDDTNDMVDKVTNQWDRHTLSK